MQLLAHATINEIPMALIVFLAGMCVGLWLVHFVYRQIVARKDDASKFWQGRADRFVERNLLPGAALDDHGRESRVAQPGRS